MRSENSNITRYYHSSVPKEETIILGLLKIKTTKELIVKLLERKSCTFNQLVLHVNKAPSTTSWNIKRLMDSNVIIRKRGTYYTKYSIKNPKKVGVITKNQY
jgi:predicted transcriptional regulator